MESVVLHIEGMSCDGCVRVVTKALQLVRGVASAKVDLQAETAQVNFDPDQVQPSQLVRAVDDTGYEASMPL